MANLADLRRAVSANLGLDNTEAGDQRLIDGWLNDGQTEILIRTKCIVAADEITLEVGVSDYTLATSILALEEAYSSPTGSNDQYLMYRKSPAEILNMRIGGSGGSPPVRFYALMGSSLLMVYPTPQAADVLNFYGVPRPTVMAIEEDLPTLPTEWHKAIEFYGCWRAGQFMNDGASQNGKTWHDLYENEIHMMHRGVLNRGGRKLSPAVIGRGFRRTMGSPSQQDV